MAEHIFIQGDARHIPLADGSVQCVVTSPPYWGLRDYGVPGQIGLEGTLDEWLDGIVEVFREVRRVLRNDGTLWLNMGDSYAQASHEGVNIDEGFRAGKYTESATVSARAVGLKPKDLVGQPWRLAFALQADGWWLRSDIIWSKPNPMPESVTDRPTKAHEYVFLMTKAARYYYDADAVREDGPTYTRKAGGYKGRDGNNASRFGGKGGFGDSDVTTTSRNARTVWEIATQPYPEAHFATFPEKLAERCIKAGTSEKGACPECGAPWRRETKTTTTPTQKVHNGAWDPSSGYGKSGWLPGRQQVTTTGWRPTCDHDAEPVPCVVLDPFSGSGTTVDVARHLNRRGIGLELSAEYIKLAQRRTAQHVLGL